MAGISALAFGIYCFIIGIGAVAFNLVELNIILMFFCFLFGIMYIIYGLTSLRTKKGQMSSFMAVGFIMGTYWWSPALPWWLWPMLVMPFVILGLTILILVREFSDKDRRKWN